MCLGNRADSSSHYINSQLAAQYGNATRCAEKHGNGHKPTLSAIEYATCLYEYYGPGKHGRYQPSRRDLSFFATFGRPRVEFVCNHEVILFLELQDGHYNLDVHKATPKHELHETIDNYTVAFRIDFSTFSINKFHCAAIGNAEDYTMNLHVLDMDSAQFVQELSHLPGIVAVSDERSFYTKERKINALVHYLSNFYLPTLKRAGYHVLHSLPDFDNLTSTTAHIDYSVISKRTLSTDVLFGVSVEDINMYLRGLWLQAASYIDEHGFSFDGSAVSKHYLAELRTVWTDTVEDIHMHLYFGPMQVQPLCKREVVLYLDLQNIQVHVGGGFSDHHHHELAGVKLAFIVDITFEESSDCVERRIKLDLATARYCEHLSVFSEFHDIELLVRIRTTLIRYISTVYMSILEKYECTCIFHHDKAVHRPSGGDTDDETDEKAFTECTCEHEDACGHTDSIRWGILQRRLLTRTETHGFDMVSAVTQGSINASFKHLWEHARERIGRLGHKKHTWSSIEIENETCLADYSYVHADHGDDEIFFSANFAPPKVQLVCKEGSQRVIFYVHLVEGYLKTLGLGKSLQPGSEAHSFSNWRLAFEVDLKLVDASEESLSESILKRLLGHGSSCYKQLVLDLHNARFNTQLSTIPGLLDEHDCIVLRKRRQALMYYIQTCYFPVFKRARHHVLYTIPTFDQDGTGRFRHTLTSLKFQILPFDYGSGKYLEGLYGSHRLIFDRNVVVFMGMMGGRPLPHHGLPRGSNWVVGVSEKIPYGTVCLSRKVFLEERILQELEIINRDTTIIPKFSGVENGKWILELTNWKNHPMKQGERNQCKWKPRKQHSHDNLEFEWNNREKWHYEHDSDYEDGGDGHYTVECHTHNIVAIPTNRRGTSTISVKGKLELNLKYKNEDKEWHSSMTSTWSAAILFTSDVRGLKIQMTPERIVPHHEAPVCHGVLGHSTHEETFKKLQEQFPKTIDFGLIVRELKDNFEDCWSGLHLNTRELIVGHPVFNCHGDLLLDLGVRAEKVIEKNVTKANGHGHHHHAHVDVSRNASSVSVTTVSSNGSATHKDGFFRKLVHKGSDFVHGGHANAHGAVGSPPPTYTPPFPLLRSTSKSSIASGLSSVTQTAASAVEVHEKHESHEELEAYSAAEEEDL